MPSRPALSSLGSTWQVSLQRFLDTEGHAYESPESHDRLFAHDSRVLSQTGRTPRGSFPPRWAGSTIRAAALRAPCWPCSPFCCGSERWRRLRILCGPFSRFAGTSATSLPQAGGSPTGTYPGLPEFSRPDEIGELVDQLRRMSSAADAGDFPADLRRAPGRGVCKGDSENRAHGYQRQEPGKGGGGGQPRNRRDSAIRAARGGNRIGRARRREAWNDSGGDVAGATSRGGWRPRGRWKSARPGSRRPCR